MPIDLSIDRDIINLGVKAARKALDQTQKDAQFALRSTVTRTASLGRKALNDALKTKLDRPVPFIYRAYFFEPAKSLEKPVARILVGGGFTAGAKADYIEAITITGKHVTSRMTKRLRRAGVLRSGEFAIPTRGIKRNSKGNINGGHLQKLLTGGKGVLIRKGKHRGLYEIKGGSKREGRLRKVYGPGREPRRYQPKVNVDLVLKPIIASFDKRFNDAFQKNVERSSSRALR